MDLCDPLPVSMSDPMLAAPRTVSDAAYGVANPGNVSPRRRHVSGKHFELFSRRTQSCRQPGRAQSFAPKVATEWCEALTSHVFPKCINARPDPRLFSLVSEVNLWDPVLDFDIRSFRPFHHVFRRNDFSFGRK